MFWLLGTAHAANGLAAFYIATGNDPACTVRNSGCTYQTDGLFMLPSYAIGLLLAKAESQAAVTHFDLVNPSGGRQTLDFEWMTLLAA